MHLRPHDTSCVLYSTQRLLATGTGTVPVLVRGNPIISEKSDCVGEIRLCR